MPRPFIASVLASVLLLGAALVLVAALPAAAQGARCAPRAQILDMVERRQSETRRAIGLTSTQAVMELYASDATGSWTLLVTLPTGLSCLVASGQGFEPDEPRPAGAPA